MFSWLAALFAWMGIQPAHLIAGLFGGLISALVEKEGTVWEKMAIGFAGGLSAAYLTPLVALLFVAASPAMMNAGAFCLGLFGMSLCKGLIGIGKIYAHNPGKLREDIRAFVLKVMSKDKNQP
ncbi:hypothetical protein [Ensifer canadensis]